MVFLVQGRMVREVTSRDNTALHVTMIVLVDIQVGPVNLQIFRTLIRRNAVRSN